jgi:hypothetical protein
MNEIIRKYEFSGQISEKCRKYENFNFSEEFQKGLMKILLKISI